MNLIIRKMCNDDLEPLYALLSNQNVMTYLEKPYSTDRRLSA